MLEKKIRGGGGIFWVLMKIELELLAEQIVIPFFWGSTTKYVLLPFLKKGREKVQDVTFACFCASSFFGGKVSIIVKKKKKKTEEGRRKKAELIGKDRHSVAVPISPCPLPPTSP